MKRLDAAYGRLAGVLEPEQRARLAEATFLDALGKLRQCRSPGRDRGRHRGSRGRPAGALAREPARRAERGLRALPRREPGVRAALELGADRVAMLPTDCPLMDPAEIDDRLGRTPRAALIVPDRHGTGTNALVLSPPDAFEPAFGPDSCARHVSRARAAGISFALERARIAGARPRHPRGHAGPPRRAAARTRARAAQRPGAVGARRRGRPGGEPPRAAPSPSSAARPGQADERPRAAGEAARPGSARSREGRASAALIAAARRARRRRDRRSSRRRSSPRPRGGCAGSPTSSRATARASWRELTGKDPALVELILSESREVVRAEPGVLITETKGGWICANAGIDSSNLPEPGLGRAAARGRRRLGAPDQGRDPRGRRAPRRRW